MKTYDISRATLDDVHTNHHPGKKENGGRSSEIEKYIEWENDWLVKVLSKNIKDLGLLHILDLGCDYGFQLYDLITRYNARKDSVGLDLFATTDIFPDINIKKMNIMDYVGIDGSNKLRKDLLLTKGVTFDVCILNHTLEHFIQPWHIIDIAINLSKYFLIALPKHDDNPYSWCWWEGHCSTWTLDSLMLFMKYYPVSLVDSKEVTFRNNEYGCLNTEIWAIFKVI